MKDNIAKLEKQNRDMIHQFLEKEIGPDEFCIAYTEFWISMRNQQERVKQTWPEPLDQKLVEAKLRGEINNKEFAQQYSELWGFAETKDLHEMIDVIHSVCSSYNPQPQYNWEVGDDQLRREVQQALAKYEQKRLVP